MHHLNLAHGLGVQALRGEVRDGAKLSVTLNLANVRAAGPTDAEAARHIDGLANRIFLEPMLRGSYPADVLDDLRHITDWSFIRDGDTELINAPIDVLGVNYYSPALVAAATPELLAEIGGQERRPARHRPGRRPIPGRTSRCPCRRTARTPTWAGASRRRA